MSLFYLSIQLFDLLFFVAIGSLTLSAAAVISAGSGRSSTNLPFHGAAWVPEQLHDVHVRLARPGPTSSER